MDRQNESNNFSRAGTGGRTSSVIAQLVKVASTIHSIDELFNWLARETVSRYGVQIVQFWTTQASRTGRTAMELRTMIYQDPSFPQQVVANSYIAEAAEQLLSRQDGIAVSPVGSIFRSHQANLLDRYGLHYFCAYSLHRNSLLPVLNTSSSAEKVPTHLSLAVFLFLHQVRTPEWEREIHSLLRQIIQFSETQGLLLSPNSAASTHPLGATPQQPSFAFTVLIPHRHEDANLLSINNPLAGASPIKDKQARRIYGAIDGHKNVETLCNITHLTLNEAYKALSVLLSEQRIQLFGPHGESIDISQILSDR